MMAEYIERKKLEEAFDNADADVCESDLDGYSAWGFGRENVRDVIRGVPAADVELAVHGRWVTHYRSGTTVAEGYVSTCCDMWNNRKSDFCPNCGARMDGGAEDG